jgi:hypothetical protein
MRWKGLLGCATIALICGVIPAASQFAIVQGEKSAGVYVNVPVDATGNLKVNCASGCVAGSGGIQAEVVAAPPTYVAGGSENVVQTEAGALYVNCVTGCSSSAGTGRNDTDAQAAVGTGLGNVNSSLYGFDGTDWNRLRVDPTSFALHTNVIAALPTGGNSIGGVTQSGVWTVGLNTAIPTGANVIGAVTQSGAWNVGQSGAWNITDISGTISLPTGAATAAKQPALGTAGASSADVITVQGRAAMTPLLVDGSGVTQPVSGTVTANQGGSNWTTNLVQLGGNNVSVNNGAVGTGVQRVTIANDSTGVVGLNTGSNTIGSVSLVPKTSGGTTPYSLIAAAGANQDSTNITTAASQLYGVCIYNNVASARYVKVYDKATGPTSADTPKFRFILNGTQGAGSCRDFTNGVAFANGIAFRITTGIADNDTGAATANDVIVNAEYK